MLMCLGPVRFDLVTNPQKTSDSEESTWARHEVFGIAPIYEKTGMGEASFTIQGVIYPNAIGTKGDIAALRAANRAQIPLSLMRGNFVPLGWVLIEKVSQDDESLSSNGVGNEIQFEVTLKKTGTPALSSLPQIMGLFG